MTCRLERSVSGLFNEDLTQAMRPLGRRNNTAFLHHVHDLGCFAVAGREATLKKGCADLAFGGNDLDAAVVEVCFQRSCALLVQENAPSHSFA